MPSANTRRAFANSRPVDFSRAVEHFTRAHHARPAAYQPLFARGQALLQAADYANAIADLEQAHTINPQGCTAAWIGYGCDCADLRHQGGGLLRHGRRHSSDTRPRPSGITAATTPIGGNPWPRPSIISPGPCNWTPIARRRTTTGPWPTAAAGIRLAADRHFLRSAGDPGY